MKRTLYSTCIAVLALSLATVQGADNKKGKGAPARSVAKSASVHASARSVGVKSSANFHSSPGITARSVRTTSPQKFTTTSYRNRVNRVNPTVTAKNNVVVNKNNYRAMNRNRVITNRNTVTARNRTIVNNNRFVNRNRNVAVNNNWRGARFSGRSYAAFRDYRRQYHDRVWWRSHYNRIVFVSGGWYYWNAGYWFPAWGYEPYYSYPYDGPIYGYNGMAPDQVIVDVQNQLSRDGYYAGPIDGELGPMTRQAIAAFQADHGLAVTSAIDEPTLSRLGIS